MHTQRMGPHELAAHIEWCVSPHAQRALLETLVSRTWPTAKQLNG